MGWLTILAVRSYFITTSTERLAAAAGLSNVVGACFLTATMTAVPAWFATWAVARSGQVVSAATTTGCQSLPPPPSVASRHASTPAHSR